MRHDNSVRIRFWCCEHNSRAVCWLCCLSFAGELETHTAPGGVTYKTIHYDDNARNAIIFMVFMWFWTSTFIQAVGQLTVALSVSRWYFCKTKSSTISSHTVVESLGTTVRYHLGTAAFGSFIIAIVSMIRTALLYVKKKFS